MAKTVLIVEDNELNMKLFHDLLEAHGYHTVGTRNGIEALDLARKHRPDGSDWVERPGFKVFWDAPAVIITVAVSSRRISGRRIKNACRATSI